GRHQPAERRRRQRLPGCSSSSTSLRLSCRCSPVLVLARCCLV
ncbi:MAG: hypothetical protein AVDCRST_MAG76-943, partial [uncultured Acidimicrobiales bacterium]